MYGYIAFYQGKQIELYANSMYEARQIARRSLRIPRRMASKSYGFRVVLAELRFLSWEAPVPVVHVAND